MDASEEGEIEVVLTTVFVIPIDAVMVDDTTMEEDFFAVTVEDGETFADDDTVENIEDDSETDEDNVTSSDG